MSKKQNPEIPQKLIDALIRTVIEQGFSPGIDAITERACVSKMTAYAQFTSRTGLTVAALERVGREVRKGLEQATRQSGCESSRDFRRVTDCLVQQLTDRDNPLAFITSCLLGHPDPRSRIHAAARKEHAAIADWLESYCKSSRTLNPQKAANAAIALIHGTFVSMLGGEPTPYADIETRLLLQYILLACMKEKTSSSRSQKMKGK